MWDLFKKQQKQGGDSLQQEMSGGWTWLGETFAADGDGHGLGDAVHDLFTKSGKNDANTGAAAGVEMTKEQGSMATNTATDILQGLGSGILAGMGLSAQADALNTLVDGLQGTGNRDYVEGAYGADVLRKCDILAELITQYGWAGLNKVVAILNSPQIQTAIGIKADFTKALKTRLEPLYLAHPEVWSLPDAPAPPTVAGKVGGIVSSTTSAITGLTSLKSLTK